MSLNDDSFRCLEIILAKVTFKAKQDLFYQCVLTYKASVAEGNVITVVGLLQFEKLNIFYLDFSRR